MNKAILGIGTNIGDRGKNLDTSIRHLMEQVGTVVKISPVYETEPWGFVSEDKFLNVVTIVETKLKPCSLLGRLLMIEAFMGRLREGKSYSSRIIDIDILFFGDTIINEGDLVVPHPKLHLRRFVLMPLYDIEPDFIHPVIKKTIRELLDECKDCGIVKPFSKGIALQDSPLLPT